MPHPTIERWFSLSPQYPSRYACIRNNPWMNGLLRECLAETLGTFFFMLAGHLGTAAFTIGRSPLVKGQEYGGFMNQALASDEQYTTARLCQHRS